MVDTVAAERDWLASYDPRAYEPIAVTVDIVALTIRATPPAEGAPTTEPTAATEAAGDAAGASPEKSLHVLLVRRGEPPFVGKWALPGGFVRR